MSPDGDQTERAVVESGEAATPPPAPTLRAKMTILAIGGVALLGIGAMCAVVFILIALDR